MEGHTTKKLLYIFLNTMSIAAFALPGAAIVMAPETGVNVSSYCATVFVLPAEKNCIPSLTWMMEGMIIFHHDTHEGTFRT